MFNSIEINLADIPTHQKDDLVTFFGMLTDLQYCDIDDYLFDNIKIRRYRNSLKQAQKAINIWKSCEKEKNLKMNFLIQLGDLIDGKAEISQKGSLTTMNEAIECLNEMNTQVFHCIGNHEVYNFNRSDLTNLPLNTAKQFNQNPANYYSYKITSNLKLICLDYYEYSLLGYKNDQDNINHLKAKKNYDHLMKFTSDFMIRNSGGLNDKQFEWLNSELKECRENKIKAIIVGHVPLHPSTAIQEYLAWNANDILDLFWSFDDVCIAYVCGHYHTGGYHLDEHNIHHITLPGIIESSPESNSFSTCLVSNHKLILNFNF